jgi:glyoxylase-like metal-dependent hydrolase (beta-lactamase superfamily II)
MITFQKFVFNLFYENTYVIWEQKSKEGMIVDPGCYTEDEKQELKNYITENNISVKYLVLTHCHLDHIFGCKFVKEEFNPIFLSPEKDNFLLEKAGMQAELFQIEVDEIPFPDKYLDRNSDLTLSNTKPKIIFTPGHTPGEYCILFEEEKVCLSGDVLFNGSIGRTDLWGGDMNTLMNSIKKEILVLDDDVKILTGHGEESTIGHERKFNPFLQES